MVGFEEYRHFNQLATPVEDARVFAATLQRFGFEVRQPDGSNIADLQDAVDAFLGSLRREDEALLFLDACRTIQLPGNKSLGEAKGFTFKNVSGEQEASFIGFASQENSVAFTGEGRLSPCTANE